MTALRKKNLNDLSVDERKLLTRKTYIQTSYFQELFQQDFKEINCEMMAKAFRCEIERLLVQKHLIKDQITLEELHNVLSDDMRAYNFDDGVNKISTFFYETDAQFIKTYHQFIKSLRQTFLKEPFWFQATPTLRLHCPNAKNSHHYPRYHSDISYGHPPEEINIWLPLTEVNTGHGFRRMSVATSNKILEQFDYDFPKFIHSAIHDKAFSNHCETLAPSVDTAFGKFIAFDARCIHSGEPLHTHTRVSMDIRILPLSQYKKMHIEYQGSGRRKILFTPGHCYDERNSDDL